jgi:hypothetical protein
LTREAKLQELIVAVGKIYYAKPRGQRNARAAVNQALDSAGISYRPDREWYFPRMCSKLGVSGGKTTAAKRKQLALNF